MTACGFGAKQRKYYKRNVKLNDFGILFPVSVSKNELFPQISTHTFVHNIKKTNYTSSNSYKLKIPFKSNIN